MKSNDCIFHKESFFNWKLCNFHYEKVRCNNVFPFFSLGENILFVVWMVDRFFTIYGNQSGIKRTQFYKDSIKCFGWKFPKKNLSSFQHRNSPNSLRNESSPLLFIQNKQEKNKRVFLFNWQDRTRALDPSHACESNFILIFNVMYMNWLKIRNEQGLFNNLKCHCIQK